MYQSLETYRGFVYPSSIDQIGHMNVASYTARFDEATWHFLARLGFTPSHMRETNRGAVAVDARTQYKREVLVGSLLHITSRLIKLGRTSIQFEHRMFDSETNELVATIELVGVYFDMTNRAPLELPEFAHRSADLMKGAPEPNAVA